MPKLLPSAKMIAFIRGSLTRTTTEYVVVEANSIGYRIYIPRSAYASLPEVGAEVEFHTYTHVKEDGITLFGFLTAPEQQLFELLVSVSGIGPKLALKAVSKASPEDFYRAIEHEDVYFLTNISGVGKKLSRRLVLELKDKLPAMDVVSTGISIDREVADTAIDALTSLGYTRTEAGRAVGRVIRDLGEDALSTITVEELIRQTLTVLGR